MNTADKEFYSQFRNFVGFANDFSDPDDDSKSDKDIARQIRIEVDPRQRCVLLGELLNDADLILASIDIYWEPLQRYVNRHFGDAGTARIWLLEMRSVWLEEIARLDKS